MKILPALVFCSILAGHVASAQPAPAVFPEKEAHAPRPLPDRIVLTWRGDPASSMAVTWRTDLSVTRATAEVTRALDSGKELKGIPVPVRSERYESNLGPALAHSAEFTGLAPSTLYTYRVGDGVNWSEWFHFRTASRDAKKFTFVYFGDAQNDVRTHWSRVFREAFQEAPRAAFTLHAGDLIDKAHNDAQWGEWLGAPGWVNATIPVVPTPGNHEYAKLDEKDAAAPRVLSRNWRPQFTLPENGPRELPALTETVYYLDYQGAHRLAELQRPSGRTGTVASRGAAQQPAALDDSNLPPPDLLARPEP
jgi:hypothetical protein